MIYAFSIIFPVFIIIGLGSIVGNTQYVARNSYSILANILHYIALPALCLHVFIKAPHISVWNLEYIIVIIGATWLVMGVSLLVANNFFMEPLGERFLHCLSGSFSNTSHIGIPLVIIAFGDQALLPVIIATIINGICILPIAHAILTTDYKLRHSLTISLYKTMMTSCVAMGKNPLFITTIIGLLLNINAVSPPIFITNMVGLVGQIFPALALITVGLSLAKSPIIIPQEYRLETLWVVIIKLILYPFVTWGIMTFIIPLEGIYAAVAILMAALPTGSVIYRLAGQYNIRQGRTYYDVLYTTLISFITLTIIMSYYL